MSTTVTVAKYFTPKLRFETHVKMTEIASEYLPEDAKVDGRFTATADGWIAHFFWTGRPGIPVYNTCLITAEVEEWFEVQYRSDGRFYYINDQGDEVKVRSASMMGSPNRHNIGAIQFPSKDFSYSRAILDESIFRFYAGDKRAKGYIEINYIAPRGTEFGIENDTEPIVFNE
jgi:hypothetical protein